MLKGFYERIYLRIIFLILLSSDRNNIPNDNTEWTKYDFVFGYIKEY